MTRTRAGDRSGGADPFLFRPDPILAIGVVAGDSAHAMPEPDLSRRIDEVAETLLGGCRGIVGRDAEFFSAAPPRLRFVARLANADERTAVEAGRRAGGEVAIVRAIGDRTGDDAGTVLALPGEPHDPRLAGRLGEALLAQSDLLIAMWDGRPDARSGSAGSLVQEAVERRIPVLVLGPGGADVIDDRLAHLLPPVAAELPREPLSGACGRVLARVFAPPAGQGERAALRDFLAEGRAPRTYRREYRALLVLAHRPRRRALPRGGRDSDPALDGDAEWKRAADLAAAVSPAGRALIERHARRAARAEELASFYGERVRSGVVLRNVGPTFGSLMISLLAIVAPGIALAWLGVQAVVMTLTVTEANAAVRGRWSERWLDCRSFAERLRCDRFLLPLGIGLARLDVETEAEDPAWMRWCHRRLVREHVPIGFVTDDVAEAAARHLQEVEIAGQIRYHEGAALRFRSLEQRLRAIGTGSILTIIGATILLFGLTLMPTEPPVVRPVLMVLLITLPSVFLAGRGLRLEGAFPLAAARSEQAVASLGALRDRMSAAAPLGYDRLVQASRAAAAAMLLDTVDWRVGLQRSRVVYRK